MKLNNYIQAGGLASYIPPEKFKEFIKELKSKFVNGMAYTDLIIKEEIDNLTGDLKWKKK